MALTEAINEALWLQGLIEEFGVKQSKIPIYSDTQSVIHLTKNQGYHEKTKHIDIRLHFIRDVVASKRVKVEKIHMKDNPTDFITESVTAIKLQKCMGLIGVSDLDQG